MARYDGREIYDVFVQVDSGVIDARSAHAARGISCHVEIYLRALHAEVPGPGVKLGFALEGDMSALSLAEIERAALEAAHDLLSRVAAESADSLQSIREGRVEYDLQEPDYSFRASED